MSLDNNQVPVQVAQPILIADTRKTSVWLKVAGVMLVILVGSFIGLYKFALDLMLPVKPGSTEKVTINVAAGASSVGVAQLLQSQGLIKEELIFRAYTRYFGIDNKLRAGEYLLSPAMNLTEIATRLTAGKVVTVSFTIPEGYNLEQIAQVLEQKGFADKERFLAVAASNDFNFDFLSDLPKNKTRLEGFLFPDTYQIEKGTSEEEIITAMLTRFQQAIGKDYTARAKAQGLTMHQAVTLASIVEREAAKDSERPKVAAVFLNRLKQQMKLESCATVQYALGEHKSRLLYKDLQVDSPYNTYKILGLPLGPIAAPGKSSLEAVVNPAPVNYLYFVVSQDGQHAFSKTLAEHNRHKAKYVARFQTQ